jgi:tRNA-Thr(GGU) m(6)t(6)A37 methyltransferase TsaA
MTDETYEVRPIGWVESSLTDLAAAPKQGDEGSPPASLRFTEAAVPGLLGLGAGDEVLLFTWLDRGRRDVVQVHPRSDPARPVQGVFGTRSPDRPNPIGLHRVTIEAIDGGRVRVRDLEVLDGTPVLDVKPVLGPPDER